MNQHHRALPSTLRDGLLCASIVGLAILLTIPVLSTGVNDDFSYTRSAFDFARTGQFHYNGWSAPILGWQLIWGALFAKLFGYSFLAVRMSTLPLAMGCAYLMYDILAGFGANRWNAALGALTFGLSPIFIAMAITFMTDVPGVFCMLLCLALCRRAVQAQTDRSAVAWLCLAAATNVVGGTVRQSVWLGVLVMVPCAGWLLRRRRGLIAATAALWLLGVAWIEVCTHWYRHQPYAVMFKVWGGTGDLLATHWLVEVVYLLLTLLLFALPLLVASIGGLARIPQQSYRRAAYGFTASVGILLLLRSVHHPIEVVLGPWLGNAISKYGVLAIKDVVWPPPEQMPRWVRLVFTTLLFVSLAGLGAILVGRPEPRAARRRAAFGQPGTAYGAAVLTLPFTLCYLATVVARAAQVDSFDRYVLPLLPTLILLFVLYYQQRLREKLPWSSIAVLVLIAAYAVAGTHDFFSLERARVAAAEEVERAGVPRSQIHGSLDYDAWTQLEVQGHMNEKLILLPAGAYQQPPHQHQPPLPCRYWFADYIPAVRPRYLVMLQPSSCFANTSFPPVEYRLWLPPFRRKVYIQQQAPSFDWFE